MLEAGACWGWLNLYSHSFKAQEGNWQWWRAVLMWVSSLSMFSWFEDTVLALWARVLKTLCLAVMWLVAVPMKVIGLCVWVFL